MAEFGCFGFRVLVMCMLTHCHGFTGTLELKRAIINVIFNTCAFSTMKIFTVLEMSLESNNTERKQCAERC